MIVDDCDSNDDDHDEYDLDNNKMLIIIIMEYDLDNNKMLIIIIMLL